MNALLSIILSFAMLFTGGALPETSDTATNIVIQDFEIEYDGEYYPLGFDIALTAAASQNGVSMHFEAIDENGEIKLPLSGAIDENGVTFTVSETGKAYHLGADLISSAMEMTEEDEAVFLQISDYLGQYASMLGNAPKGMPAIDPEDAEAMLEIVTGNMQDFVQTDTEWDFGNGPIPAQHMSGTISGVELVAIIDGWMQMDDEYFSPLLRYMLDMYNMVFSLSAGEIIENTVEVGDAASVGVIGGADGPTAVYVAGEEVEFTPAESFTELFAMLLGDDISMLEQVNSEMTMISAQQGETELAEASLLMDFGELMEATASINCKAETADDYSLIAMDMYMDQPDAYVDYQLQTAIEGPMSDPVSVDSAVMMDISTVTGEDADGYTTYDSVTVMSTASMTYDEELTDVSMQMEFGNHSDTEEGGISGMIDFYIDQEYTDEGSIASDINLYIEPDLDPTVAVSLTAVTSEIPAPAYFAGREMLEMTMEDDDPAMDALSIDALALMSDAMAIAANEDFMALTGLLSGEYEGDYDEYDDEYDYYEEYVQLASLEEAAEIFAGKLPAFPDPEGYLLSNVQVHPDGYLVIAEYENENGECISMQINSYGELSGPSAYILEDGLKPIDAPLVNLSTVGESYYSASINYNGLFITFYFDAEMSFEDVEKLISAVEF